MNINSWYQTNKTTKKVTTVREYDAQGRVLKETVTEETYTEYPQYYPTTQPYIHVGGGQVYGSDTYLTNRIASDTLDS